jgi:hypothetical protein
MMRLRRAVLLVMVIVCCLLVAAAVGLYSLLDSSSSTTKTQHEPLQTYRPSSVALIAQRLSASMGDPSPNEILVTKTTREKALRVISPEEEIVGGAPANTPVWIFAMRGKFRHSGSVPHGARAPTGTWLTVSLDIETGQILDLSLTHARPDLSTLGAIRRLRVRH